MQLSSAVSDDAPKAWRWPVAITALLVFHVVAMVVVVFVATRDPSFAVEPHAYKKAVSWDEARSQHLASERLGWKADVQVGPAADPLGRRRVVCSFKDHGGIAVMAATVRLEAFHHARASERLNATFEPATDGSYWADLPLRRAGIWEFRLIAERGAERFETTLTQQLEGTK